MPQQIGPLKVRQYQLDYLMQLKKQDDDLKYWIIDFCQVFRFLTIIPVGSALWLAKAQARPLAKSLWAFPLVGLALAGLGYGLYWGIERLFPANIAISLMMIFLIIITGAFHEDGLADSADGLGGKSQAERLTIMKDHRIGAYGTIALVMVLVLRWQLLILLAAGPIHFFYVLLAEQVLSRFWMIMALYKGPWAKSTGLAVLVGKPALKVVLSAAIITFLCLLPLPWRQIGIIIVGSIIFFWVFMALTKRLFGGITGDLIGALQQFQQLMILLMFHIATIPP